MYVKYLLFIMHVSILKTSLHYFLMVLEEFRL
jgi:hypothetical protein